MATREEIINGIQLLIQESQRVAGSLTAADWARAQDMDGWKNNQVLAHVASVGGMVAPMMQGMVNAPDGANAGAGIDIDALNAAMVGQRKDKAIDDLAAEVKTAYTAAIEHIRTVSDDVLAKPVSFRGYENVPLSDVLIRMVVLHGLAHIYGAYAAVFNSVDQQPAAAS
ncbi:MAG TPA: maleylpyruvate isomerase N-terminal domain-containing protein [Dehalococcoidia bacterium]|jgi:hypothetical protein|nr:maleylpyruvate isomerase N-terminal domain-containing protein [Dehalococcoidia bacterium]